MTKHYPYSPSAMTRIVECPGSVSLAQLLPNEDTEFSTEGTLAHAAAEAAIRDGTGKVQLSLVNGDVDLQAAAQMFVDQVTVVRSAHTAVMEFIEERLVHPTVADFGGTLDYGMIYMEQDGSTTLHIVDFKAGVGVPVHAYGNKQLLAYAALVDANYFVPIEKFILQVVQPRNSSVEDVQTWECGSAEIAELVQQVIAAQSQTHMKAGPHCRFCPVASRCNEIHKHMLTMIAAERSDPRNVPAETLRRWTELFELRSIIRKSLDQIEDDLINAVRFGANLPQYKVIQKLSNRRWVEKDESVLLRSLADAGVTLTQATKTTVKSPAQIEALAKTEGLEKKVLTKVVGELSKRYETGYELVDRNARGKEISTNPFQDLTNGAT